MNQFLTSWAKQLYYNVENKNIQYLSLTDFLRKTEDKQVTVILDEIDIMNGCNSFYIDSFYKTTKCLYLQKHLKGFKTWVGFSATFSDCGRELSNLNFPESFFIDIQNINQSAGENAIV